MKPPTNLIDAIVQGATVDLFRTYGVAVAPVPRRVLRPTSVPEGYCGMISFTGQGFTGTLTLSVPTPILGLTKAGAQLPLHERDWIRELANQLMGRIKTRLLQLQVALRIGLPSTMDRRMVERRHAATTGSLLVFEFRTIRDEVTVTLEGTFDEWGFKYSGNANPGSEGDVIIF